MKSYKTEIAFCASVSGIIKCKGRFATLRTLRDKYKERSVYVQKWSVRILLDALLYIRSNPAYLIV